MANLKYEYNSDITKSKCQIIAHQCYCTSKSKLAKGLAKSIFNKFPYADIYSNREIDSIPGTIKVSGSKKERWVCAIYGQYHPGAPSGKNKDSSKNRVEWFKLALQEISKIKNLRNIAFPENIGCGLAKGDWTTYLNMLIHFQVINPNITVTIVSLHPEPQPVFKLGFIEHLALRMTSEDLPTITLDYLIQCNKEHEFPAITEEQDIEILPETSEEIPTWQNTTLEDFTEKNIPAGWEEFFQAQLDIDNGAIHEISKFMYAESTKYDIFPELHLIYNAFVKTPLENVKVLLLGMDPYINLGEAMGISFSVPKDVSIPPSLRNIYKELIDDGFSISDKNNGNLEKWCDQGVLMINCALTVRAHESGSHSKKWIEYFTPSLMRWLNEKSNGPLVVIMWGRDAQGFSKFFGDQHKKIQSVHPSPLSASRGFFGSKPFSKANRYLENLGKEPIDWSL
jgi:uracil-DNA glycosylase